jgi:hypothetical protein
VKVDQVIIWQTFVVTISGATVVTSARRVTVFVARVAGVFIGIEEVVRKTGIVAPERTSLDAPRRRITVLGTRFADMFLVVENIPIFTFRVAISSTADITLSSAVRMTLGTFLETFDERVSVFTRTVAVRYSVIITTT